MAKINPKKRAAKGKGKSVYVSRHRQQQKRRGLRRMELAVNPRHIPLIRSYAAKLDADESKNKSSKPKVRTTAGFLALMKKLGYAGDDIQFHRDNISRRTFSFEEP